MDYRYALAVNDIPEAFREVSVPHGLLLGDDAPPGVIAKTHVPTVAINSPGLQTWDLVFRRTQSAWEIVPADPEWHAEVRGQIPEEYIDRALLENTVTELPVPGTGPIWITLSAGTFAVLAIRGEHTWIVTVFPWRGDAYDLIRALHQVADDLA